jgi:hypothetical protein
VVAAAVVVALVAQLALVELAAVEPVALLAMQGQPILVVVAVVVTTMALANLAVQVVLG